MKKISLTAITLNIVFNALGQSISGNIILSSHWKKTLYIKRLDHIDLKPTPLIDSIKISEEGNFKYRFSKNDPLGLLYKIVLPPEGGNAQSSISGTQDNYFIVSTEGNENIEIAANADSLYYTLKIISKKAMLCSSNKCNF